ncbi:4'-phosphopantetheinyl transferase family protein [Paenibacillus thalictri]|uniref:4'-phosphopantetheinyl transferase superfamily protein n=1 Tax=Paenibacillus thalictri TaxID=2527873 RepID=A0A4Q9DLN8_9BACL|nr:4'-phosphopantetheinyl transferase superfamily protein [Paenibacillus thalictri]TBL76115.1 4'-phosphopantetheinyl transferase superfamily protein [Paenibacillus thalictri]
MKLALLTLPAELAAYREQLLACIDSDKRRRLLRYRHQEDRDRSMLADIFIRYTVMRAFGLRNRDIAFQIGEWGKPALQLPVPFHFNCSHAGIYVAAAIAEEPVGCDIEIVERADLGVARLVFTTDECRSLLEREGFERDREFYRLWTRKESYVKATGKGIGESLPSYGVLGDRVSGDEAWAVRSYNVEPDVQIAVCCASRNFPERVEKVDTLPMLRAFLQLVAKEG